MVKNLPTQKMQVPSLGREDPLGEKTAIPSSILSKEIAWTVEPGGLQSTGVQKESDVTYQLNHTDMSS